MNGWFSLILRAVCTAGLMWGPTPGIIPPRPTPQSATAGGEGLEPPRDEISPAQEQAMWEEFQRTAAMLRATGALPQMNSPQAVTYNFPLRLAPGLPDYAGFRVSAFADHNSAAGQVLDYNGGARTYDAHRGADYALYPFSWNKVNGGEVQVIAAAAGTIWGKSNGDPTDHNPCDGGSSADNWNYVALTHADGRMTIYGHMRYNSLTSKTVGQTVAQGEYLGEAASSGNSSGPHLHFEVRYGSFSNAEWIDPYSGPNSQPTSSWTNQRPYYDSAINKQSTHDGPPSTPDPCQPSMTRLQDSFTTLSNIYLYAHYRDYQGTLTTQLNIYRPDGSVYNSWQYTPGSPAFNSSWSYGSIANLPANEPAGAWRFEATYNGQVYQTFFNVNAPPAIAVASPNGGEQWPRPLTHSVTWTDNLGGDVNIALYHNGVYSAAIASNTPSDGAYLWSPDPAQAPGPGYKIRVTSVISPSIFDESDAPFTLLSTIPLPSLGLTKTTSALTPQPGQTIDYILTLANSGAGVATGARLVDSLPAGLTLAGPITLSPPGLGTPGTLPDAVTNLTLAAGQSLTVTIPVYVNMGQPAGVRITNTASLTCAEITTASLASSVITLADAPLVARDDFAITPITTPVTIAVLDNDGDPNGDPITITALGLPMSGTVSLVSARLVYTPTLVFVGADVFTYTVRTSAEEINATVTVRVVAAVFRVFLPFGAAQVPIRR